MIQPEKKFKVPVRNSTGDLVSTMDVTLSQLPDLCGWRNEYNWQCTNGFEDCHPTMFRCVVQPGAFIDPDKVPPTPISTQPSDRVRIQVDLTHPNNRGETKVLLPITSLGRPVIANHCLFRQLDNICVNSGDGYSRPSTRFCLPCQPEPGCRPKIRNR